jgi:hypothetical protein
VDNCLRGSIWPRQTTFKLRRNALETKHSVVPTPGRKYATQSPCMTHSSRVLCCLGVSGPCRGAFRDEGRNCRVPQDVGRPLHGVPDLPVPAQCTLPPLP